MFVIYIYIYIYIYLCDENSLKNWRLAQLDVDIKIKKYNIDMESKVLSSNNKSTFYKFINKKLHSSNLYDLFIMKMIIQYHHLILTRRLVYRISIVLYLIKVIILIYPYYPYHVTYHHHYPLILLLLRYYVHFYVYYLVNSIIH